MKPLEIYPTLSSTTSTSPSGFTIIKPLIRSLLDRSTFLDLLDNSGSTLVQPTNNEQITSRLLFMSPNSRGDQNFLL